TAPAPFDTAGAPGGPVMVLDSLAAVLARAPKVQSVITWHTANDSTFLSRDGRRTLFIVSLEPQPNGAADLVPPVRDSIKAVLARVPPGYQALVTGRPALDLDVRKTIAEDTRSSELRVFPLTLLVLVLAFGALVAAVLPLVVGFLAIAISLAIIGWLTQFTAMSIFVLNMTTMIGLGVGIDYSLFILYRHRKQLLQGADVVESIGLANGTAGNAVVFAGTTVIVALLALNITGIPFLGLMGTAGAVSVGIAVLIAISLTPALLGLAGTRVLGRRARTRAAAAAELGSDTPRSRQRGVRPMSNLRAVLTLLLAMAALLVIAIPALSMRLGLPDGGSEAADSSAYRAFTLTEDSFGEGVNGPLLVTATLPEGLDDDEILDYQLQIGQELAAMDDVVAVAPIAVSDDGTLTAFQVVPAEGPNSVSTETLVRDLRELPPIADGVTLGVAGQAAINIDISEGLANVLPLYLLVVVGLSFLIMVMVFRSLLV
ncbi:MAG: MMPL family transporter, partial [Myxococcota bacterium]